MSLTRFLMSRKTSFMCISDCGGIKQSQHRLYFLRKEQRGKDLMVAFYRSTLESIITHCLTVWYAGCTAADEKTPHRVI